MERLLVGAVVEVVGRHVAGDEISCEGPGLEGECLDKAAATRLKTVAIIVIFLTSFLGFYIPVSSRRFRFLNLRGNPFWMMKVFAGGVILATAFIHMLPTAQNDFASPCLPQNPRGEIPVGRIYCHVRCTRDTGSRFRRNNVPYGSSQSSSYQIGDGESR
ncbi:fe(2+) transport protein 2-like isoform X1 [Physcomitrium patens]|uniref:Uncharacterized protein n=1 Tax=Physcomitrium patens TaxID=3218 RepID=A0A2K1J0H3_PHYPA|nr:hypothetical protein PHYPA_022926 [Physcomitrium patens]